jgi:DNA-binding MarR family transcriptional regulator
VYVDGRRRLFLLRPSARSGFHLTEFGRLYSQQFDRRSREMPGLSLARYRLLAVLVWRGNQTMSQSELAQIVGITPMAVATMGNRMTAADWIERRIHSEDRRVNHLHVLPKAHQALVKAIRICDELTDAVLEKSNPSERQQIVSLSRQTRETLLALGHETTGAHTAKPPLD